jgi:hypothetical protein
VIAGGVDDHVSRETESRDPEQVSDEVGLLFVGSFEPAATA